VYLQEVETWAAAIIILRELFISAFRLYFLINDASFSASIPAKTKTTFQIVAISILILYRKMPYADYFYKLGTVVLYIAIFLTIYSGVEYVIRYSHSLKE
jgi:CDP-diacylglycerol--glycerol-3-phosphate 3-phosphatidyltransferase